MVNGGEQPFVFVFIGTVPFLGQKDCDAVNRLTDKLPNVRLDYC